MRDRARTAVLAAVLLVASACGGPAGRSSETPDGWPEIRLTPGSPVSAGVDVIGLPAADLDHLERATLTRDEWTALLRVTVAGTPGASSDLPAVLGTHAVATRALRFTPQFPFDPGQRYDVRFDPSQLPSVKEGGAAPRVSRLHTTLQVPAPERHATTRVVEVYPTALEVPENQLRLYIAFSAPMGLRGGSEHVRLEDQDGRPVVDPFLPVEVDLWNDDRTRYTLLFDPGRVKRGILPNEEMGRSLIEGRQYTLVVDLTWRDAAGQPLAASFRRAFRVGPPEARAIDPADWRLEVPPDGTRAPLVAWFPKPLDYGLLHRALSVSNANGERLDGDIELQGGETRWVFTPHAAWRPGEYRLLAASILEDVAGNRIGRPFEVDALAEERTAPRAVPAALPFLIR